MQLNAGGIHTIAYGENRDETGITTINHLINPVGKSIYTDTRESNKIKKPKPKSRSRQERK